MKYEVPWPPYILGPNSRSHWAVKLKAKNKYIDQCKWSFLGKAPELKEGDIPLIITFHPPDKRVRDDDNYIGCLKSVRDYMAKKLGVNDSRFKPDYRWAEVVKGGKVIIEIVR